MKTVSPPPGKPVMIYDGECEFCRHWAMRWRKKLFLRVEFITIAEALTRFPQLPRAQIKEAVHLVSPDGSVSWGAEAVFRAQALKQGILSGLPLFFYRRVPGMHFFAEMFYKWVAHNRNLFFHLGRWLG